MPEFIHGIVLFFIEFLIPVEDFYVDGFALIRTEGSIAIQQRTYLAFSVRPKGIDINLTSKYLLWP